LRQAGNRLARAFAYAVSARWRTLFKILKPSPQAQGVELIDGKCSDAALRTPWSTDQPLAAAACCLG
jgi:hypothetical protein